MGCVVHLRILLRGSRLGRLLGALSSQTGVDACAAQLLEGAALVADHLEVDQLQFGLGGMDGHERARQLGHGLELLLRGVAGLGLASLAWEQHQVGLVGLQPGGVLLERLQ